MRYLYYYAIILIPRPHLVFNVVHSLRTLKFVAMYNIILNAHNSIYIWK